MKKIIVCALICILSIGLFACNKKIEPEITPDLPTKLLPVDYSIDNDYSVTVTENDDAVEFVPDGARCEYGVIFYVGTSIAPNKYMYLGNALAKQGYLVVMPKRPLNMTYFQYAEKETAFSNHPRVKFFLAGHSQGGGAAVKRAQENADKIEGIFLLAPLTYTGDTIKDTNIPTLLINADNDHVLTDRMEDDAKATLPENRTEILLENACHMSFSENDADSILKFFGDDGPMTDEFRTAQRNNTLSAVLDFMKSTIFAQN
ncbi:MAG: alpha/beta hydrolase [Clostridia bacterium]|nr:alpha/beta hydrolase [Clostridia bacterium]